MSAGRPPGPKKIAALAQAEAMHRAGTPDAEIRQALIVAGLTKAQSLEIVPLADSEKAAPAPAPIITDDARRANIEGAAFFLESIAKRISPNAVDRFNELSGVKSDALTWARKIRGLA